MPMIGYVTLGTNDLARGAAFYDALLAEIGARRIYEDTESILWGVDGAPPGLCLHVPFDKQPATVGNGVMVALSVGSHARVDALHARALALGAADEGAPGPRGDSGLYAAYFRDLDGNKLSVYNHPAG
jgi:catechol 2,3-dioxygenase-like lactoylglutathione lyase family enzyme